MFGRWSHNRMFQEDYRDLFPNIFNARLWEVLLQIGNIQKGFQWRSTVARFLPNMFCWFCLGDISQHILWGILLVDISKKVSSDICGRKPRRGLLLDIQSQKRNVFSPRFVEETICGHMFWTVCCWDNQNNLGAIDLIDHSDISCKLSWLHQLNVVFIDYALVVDSELIMFEAALSIYWWFASQTLDANNIIMSWQFCFEMLYHCWSWYFEIGSQWNILFHICLFEQHNLIFRYHICTWMYHTSLLIRYLSCVVERFCLTVPLLLLYVLHTSHHVETGWINSEYFYIHFCGMHGICNIYLM